MDAEQATELAYLAAQVGTTKQHYDAAIEARNTYMRQLDRLRVPQHEIAAAAGLSQPQTLRIVSKEVDTRSEST